MAQLGRDPDFLEKTIGPEGLGQTGIQDLDRDHPVVPHIASQVHGGHATAPQFALEPIPLGERSCQTGRRIRQTFPRLSG